MKTTEGKLLNEARPDDSRVFTVTKESEHNIYHLRVSRRLPQMGWVEYVPMNMADLRSKLNWLLWYYTISWTTEAKIKLDHKTPAQKALAKREKEVVA